MENNTKKFIRCKKTHSDVYNNQPTEFFTENKQYELLEDVIQKTTNIKSGRRQITIRTNYNTKLVIGEKELNEYFDYVSMEKIDFEIEVVKRTNELIQNLLTKYMSQMKGWCVPFSTHLNQAIIDAKYVAKRKIRMSDLDNTEEKIWTAVIKELDEIKIEKYDN